MRVPWWAVALLAASIILLVSGCTKAKVMRIPKPNYPKMEDVRITKGCVCGPELRKVIRNMLKLQQHVDELSICPGWEEK